ncbi:N-formylglutamate amidohydrolase [Actibacterium mucosum KCTC 23349]|uniref:N-formylglutamate amidohydrolase n=1 Tax=Actibacterium mucosum KCTC 23349 TaxID=1454373 RepID=A0A037ZEE1_9RHOB|nr:N-formylglutamate amidohydrolase [Actibacterium mucosum]KAJ54850.1 N-formylglutamate amidohydrolase [Actibacterium mucosum KCTC 23349]
MNYIPFEIKGEARNGRFLITCDHAANTVPPFVNGGDLGLPVADMARHIAFDPGAAGVATFLGEALDAPVVLSNFSRLVIDPNRGLDDPTLLMRLYDGSVIPANAHADATDLQQRIDLCYAPYHDALTRMAARRDDTVIVSVHSFTPQLNGYAPRPWQVAILHAADARLSLPLIEHLRADPDLCVGHNQPYNGHLPGDAIDRHAEIPGRPSTLIELRNDLISDELGQRDWAARLAPALNAALTDAQL